MRTASVAETALTRSKNQHNNAGLMETPSRCRGHSCCHAVNSDGNGNSHMQQAYISLKNNQQPAKSTAQSYTQQGRADDNSKVA